MNTNNIGPTVKWLSTSNQTVSGIIYLDANASRSLTGSAYISQWCATWDGTPLSQSGYFYFTNDSGQSVSTAFNKSTGCWSTTYSGSSNQLSFGELGIDTTGDPNGLHTVVITVSDSSGRTASSTFTYTSSNAAPIVALTSLSTSPVKGVVSLNASATPDSKGTATIAFLCVTINGTSIVADLSDGTKATFDSTKGCWKFSADKVGSQSLVLQFDTTSLKNGSQSIVLTGTDSNGRSTSSTLNFSSINPSASIASLSALAITPRWSDKTSQISVTINCVAATSFVIRYGTTTALMSSSSGTIDPSQGDSQAFTLGGFAPKTKIYYQITVTGLNGSSKSAVKSITTAAIPPKAFIVSTACNANEYIGTSWAYGPYYYWYWNYVYHWSNGGVTYGTQYMSLGNNRPC